MKKTRRRYDREFKISVVAELEVANLSLRSLASIASILAYLPDGEMSWPRILKKRLVVTEISIRTKQGLRNLRDCLARLMPRSSF